MLYYFNGSGAGVRGKPFPSPHFGRIEEWENPSPHPMGREVRLASLSAKLRLPDPSPNCPLLRAIIHASLSPNPIPAAPSKTVPSSSLAPSGGERGGVRGHLFPSLFFRLPHWPAVVRKRMPRA